MGDTANGLYDSNKLLLTSDMKAGTQSRPVRHGVRGWRAQAPMSVANGGAVAASHTTEPLADCDPAMQ